MATATRSLRGHDVHFAPPAKSFGQRLAGFAAMLLAALDVAGERRQLRRMDARQLKDIGISRADAMREAERGFWDLPKERMPKL
ncbi:MAG: DUF1127 domain-containing protein, partial [Hyphomicrobiales bacterium]|nr:DUF1127 domain-containing protein [Hyphomicrobiales bacterium]